MANSWPIFDRLAGLETEYAIRFKPLMQGVAPPEKYTLYQHLVAAVRNRTSAVEAKHFKPGIFTANGGALWFEAERPASGGGLVEGSTPECRGPQQLLAYQRAQDELLSEAANHAGVFGAFHLVKNDQDFQGNVYGAQENYEVAIATGWRLLVWRIGLALLLPFVALATLLLLLTIVSMLTYLAIAWAVYWPLRSWDRDRRLALLLFGRDMVEGQDLGAPTPIWMENVLLWLTRIITAPVAIGLWVLVRSVCYSRIRRSIVPLLLSRCVIGGSGLVTADNDFVLADKGLAINSVIGYGGYFHERPLFVIGHFFKLLCAEAVFSPRDYFDLFSPRQRLQIGLGDSNMSPVAEYLRIGTTMLVLDVIEAGELPKPPRFRRPISVLHRFVSDAGLNATAEDTQGRSWTAIDLQRFYLRACHDFLTRRPNAPGEAWDVVQRWSDMLDGLEDYRQSGHAPSSLIGTLDWVTKRFLLDEAGPDASWEQRKKIDIRYHELSPEGYFQRLRSTGVVPEIVTAEEIDRARRTAPPNSPATMRSRYIREFNDGSLRLRVNWKRVFIGEGLWPKSIRLARYGRGKSGEA